ncbi:MAG: XylR family transcriptional regulator [Planctomycetota bacterium]
MIRQPVVLLALGSYQHATHRGVARFAREQGWHLVADMAYGGQIPRGWEGDGIITSLTDRDELTDFVIGTGAHVVDLNMVRADIPLPRVVGNHEAIGKLAAMHLLERGFEQFAWYAVHENRTALDRRTGFLRELNDEGMDLSHCTNLIWSHAPVGIKPSAPNTSAGQTTITAKGGEAPTAEHDWTHRRDWIIQALDPLPKPLAVFAYNDYQASHVINACLHAGIQIPEQVAVVGVDNDELVCECLPVPLSSVKHDLETRGYQGAALLAQRMKGPIDAPIPDPVRIDPSGVVTRKSSDILALPDPQVAKALRHIWNHFHEPLSISEVVAATQVSRRTLEKAFRQHLQRSILDEVQRVRLQRVKELLAHTDFSMRQIATQAGFASPQYLHQIFRKELGTTPGDYRKQHTAG